MGRTVGSRSCAKRLASAYIWILAAIVLCLKLPESPLLCQSQEVPGGLDEIGSSSDNRPSESYYYGVAIVGFTLKFPGLGDMISDFGDPRSQEDFVREYIHEISLAVGWGGFVETQVLAIAAGRVSTAVYYQSPEWRLPSSAISPKSLGAAMTDNPGSIFSAEFLAAYGNPALATAVNIVLTTPSPVAVPQDTPSSFPPSGLTTATPLPTLQEATPAESTNAPSLPPYETEAAAEAPLEPYPTPASTYHNHTVLPSPGRNQSACSQQPSSSDCGLQPQVRIVTACEEADCSGQQGPLDSTKPHSFLAYVEGPLNGFSPDITYLWAWGANYSFPLADVLEDGSGNTNQLLQMSPAQLPEMRRRFALSVTAKNETSGLSSEVTVEVQLSYPPSCDGGVPNSSGHSPCIQVFPEEGIALGKTSFSVLTSGWRAGDPPEDDAGDVELRYKYGYLYCTEPTNARCAYSSIPSHQQSHMSWISDFTPQSSFNFSALPAGTPSDDYRQTIVVCVAVAKLGVVQPAEACGVQQVRVLPLGSENSFDESWIQEKLEQAPSLADPDALAMLLAISKSLEAQPQGSALDLHDKLMDLGLDLLNSTGPGLALTSSVVQMSRSIAARSNATELADIAALLQQVTLLGNAVDKAQGPELASQLSSAALDAVSTILTASANKTAEGLHARELVADVLQSTRAVVSQLATSISGGRLPGDVEHFGAASGMQLSIITGYPETMAGKVLSLAITDRQLESPSTRRLMLVATERPSVALPEGFVSFCAQSTISCTRPMSIALSYTSSNHWLLAGMGQAAFADAVATYLDASAQAIKSALKTIIISGVIGLELLHVFGVVSFGFGDSFQIVMPLDAQVSTPSNDVSRFCIRIDYAQFQPEVVGMAEVRNGYATCNATLPGDYTIVELIHAGESTTSATRYHGAREGDEEIDALKPDNLMLRPIALTIPSSAIGITVVVAALAGLTCFCFRAFAGHAADDGEHNSHDRFPSGMSEDSFALRKRESYNKFLERVVSQADDDAAVETPTSDDQQAARVLWSDDPGMLHATTGGSGGRLDIAAWASQGTAPWIYSQSKRITMVRTKTARFMQQSGAVLSHLMVSSKNIVKASLASAWRQSTATREVAGHQGYASSGPGRPHPARVKHFRILDAVTSGNTKLVQAILKSRKATLPCDVAGRTPLHIAAMIGCVDILTILLQWSDQHEDAGVETALINAKDYSGRTCLHLAGKLGKHMVVEALFHHKGRHVMCSDTQDADGRTALHLCAIDSECGKTASALILGASKTPRVMAASDQSDRKASQAVTAAWTDGTKPHCDGLPGETACDGTNMTTRDKFGWTVLHLAAGHGRLDILSELLSPKSLDAQNLDAGSLINLQDHEGWTALHLAAARGKTDAARILIAHPDCSLRICDWDGWTVLHIAAVYGQQAIVPPILEQSLQRNVEITEETDAGGKPALHYAAMYGHVSIVRLILKFEDRVRSLKAKQEDPRRLEGSSSATYAPAAGIRRLWFTVSFGLGTGLPPVGRQLMRFLTGETRRPLPSTAYHQEELDHAGDASSPEDAIHAV